MTSPEEGNAVPRSSGASDMVPLEEDNSTLTSQGAHAKRNKRKKELAKLRKEEAKATENDKQEVHANMNENELLDALQKELAKIELSKESEKDNSVPVAVNAKALYEIKSAPGKGFGMFALKDIAKGRGILREAPLFRGGRPWLSKEAAFAVLSDDKKKRFLALHSRCMCHKTPCMETQVMKIWDCNSFETPASVQNGRNCVYEIGSRLNHSCVPNTNRKFTRDHNIVFIAKENIKKGEEITTDYLGACGTTEVRRKICSTKYGFICRCRACRANQNMSYNAAFRALAESDYVDDGNGAAVLNKPTDQEVAAEEEVVKWLKHLTRCTETVQLRLMGWMKESMKPNAPAELKCKGVAAASMMAWEECLKDENKFNLSDDVLNKYNFRVSQILFDALWSQRTKNDPDDALVLFFAHIRGTIAY